MMKLLGVLLAIILHGPSSLHADALSETDASPPTGTREPIIKPFSNQATLWLKGDRPSGDLRDYVQHSTEHLRSRLLSALYNDLKGLEELGYYARQTSQLSQQYNKLSHAERQKREEYEKVVEEDAEDDQLKPKEREEHEDEEEKEEGKTRSLEVDEYVQRQEEKYQKPEVHLFKLPESQLRRNLEHFQQQNPRLVRFEVYDLLGIRRKQPIPKTTDNNSTTSRVEQSSGNTTEFSYENPEEWFIDNPQCAGRLQSPVNLDSDKLVGLDVPSSLSWTGYWNRPQNFTLINNGHTVELSGTWEKNTTPFIRGGPLVGDYVFAQLHFHWGPKDSAGSEHSINNRSFPMEMHMVHYKRDYGTLRDAQQHNDGLGVVGFFVEISEKPNFGFNLLEDSLSKIQSKPGVPVSVKPFPLTLLHFTFQENYITYMGSLTTPPCREIVTWIIPSSPITISRKQLESFRKISNKWPEKRNYRPQQPLYGRRLYYVGQ